MLFMKKKLNFDAFFKIAKEVDNLGVSGEVSVDGNHIVQ